VICTRRCWIFRRRGDIWDLLNGWGKRGTWWNIFLLNIFILDFSGFIISKLVCVLKPY